MKKKPLGKGVKAIIRDEAPQVQPLVFNGQSLIPNIAQEESEPLSLADYVAFTCMMLGFIAFGMALR